MKVTDAGGFGAAVRARRRELGYTQRQLADVSGCGVRFVSELERGKPTSELGKALAVASMLSLDVELSARGGAR